MSYPLIILGAGASYDYRTDGISMKSPPLTNELFDLDRFSPLIERYSPHIPSLASSVNSFIAGNRGTLEEHLTKIRDEHAINNGDRYKELLSMLFYLSDVFKEISKDGATDGFQPVNNYNALLGCIKDNGGKACIVTYNYDLLLEKTMGLDLNNNNSYVSGDIRIIKIHGSCHWYYRRSIQGFDDKSSYDFSLLASKSLVEKDRYNYPIEVYHGTNNRHINSTGVNSIERTTLHPALALPMSKKDSYVCPDDHISELLRAIRSVDRVLIIGWKAGDRYLIELLEKEFKDKDIEIAIVGGENIKEEVKGNLSKELFGKTRLVDSKGFLHFMQSGKCEEFLSKEITK